MQNEAARRLEEALLGRKVVYPLFGAPSIVGADA
jgi:hypothetical protein